MSIAIPHKRAQWLADLFFAPPLMQEYLEQRTMAAREIEPKPVRQFPSHKPLATQSGTTRFASKAPVKAPLRFGGDFWTSLVAAVGGMWVLQGLEDYLRSSPNDAAVPTGDFRPSPEEGIHVYLDRLQKEMELAFKFAFKHADLQRLIDNGDGDGGQAFILRHELADLQDRLSDVSSVTRLPIVNSKSSPDPLANGPELLEASNSPETAEVGNKRQSHKARVQAFAEQHQSRIFRAQVFAEHYKDLDEKMDPMKYRQEVLGLPADTPEKKIIYSWHNFIHIQIPSAADRRQMVKWTVQATGSQHLPFWGGARPHFFSNYPNGPVNGMHTKESLEAERLRLAAGAAQQVRETGVRISVRKFRAIVLGLPEQSNRLNFVWNGYVVYRTPEVKQQFNRLCKEATGYKNADDEFRAQGKIGIPLNEPKLIPVIPPPAAEVQKSETPQPDPPPVRPPFNWIKGPRTLPVKK